MSETAGAAPAGGLGALAAFVPSRASLQALTKRTDLFFATAVMGILTVLIFPLPAYCSTCSSPSRSSCRC